ncbi:MAG: dolichol-phosphate mannosyltransferase [Pseudonocardia sp.]|jgi:dolichol-phosphate mannosyltransferase|nr:dolichol-phosphate mannosyltransferase [Pseudonocardia sp.]
MAATSDEPLGAATAAQQSGKLVQVVIPTYNERENLEAIVARLHAVLPDAEVLVVDDSSPDGTGRLADGMAAADDRIRVLHRSDKDGLGAAYLAGFAAALRGPAEVIVEMDADGSHAPEDLPAMLTALQDADIVLGSRYVRGGQVVNWPLQRRLLSQGGNLYSRLALGVGIRDLTGGYRAFHRSVLEELDLADVSSQGYCFQVDLAWRAVQAGFRVHEVPITFTERERGESKMNSSIVTEALWKVTAWGVAHRLGRLRPRREAEKSHTQ